MESYLQELKKKFQEAVAGLRDELGGLRTNRPSPSLLESVRVEYGGQMLPIQQLASIGIVPPRQLVVTVWDSSLVSPVAKAIETSPLRLVPNVDKNTIRLNLPPLTEERKQELMKLVKGIAENYRIRIRVSRDDVNKKIAQAFSEKRLNEDQRFALKKAIQEEVDAANGEIENLLERKTKEITE